MKLRNFKLGVVSFILFFLILELISRLVLVFFGYSFIHPKSFIVDNYYTELRPLVNEKINKDDGYYDILILGASAISTEWSQMDARLDSLLATKNVRIFDVAIPGQSSLDNAIKYDLLKNKGFDLVIYYEAINDNRENNMPREFFQEDYSHREGYHYIGLLRKHPEINFITLPYVLHMSTARIGQKIKSKTFLKGDKINKEYLRYGSDIKTADSYKKNLESIICLASEKQEKLLLIAYTSFFPNVSLLGEVSDRQYFTKDCRGVTSVSAWGDIKNTRKGIGVHNDILTKLATEYKTLYLDMRKMIPHSADCFCDICHLSEKGCVIFAKALADYIISNSLLNAKDKIKHIQQ